jgi:hypothetical protein
MVYSALPSASPSVVSLGVLACATAASAFVTPSLPLGKNQLGLRSPAQGSVLGATMVAAAPAKGKTKPSKFEQMREKYNRWVDFLQFSGLKQS